MLKSLEKGVLQTEFAYVYLDGAKVVLLISLQQVIPL